MKPKTCIKYLGVDYNHDDLSGDGDCLDVFDPEGNLAKCRDTIRNGRCPKKRPSPNEDDER